MRILVRSSPPPLATLFIQVGRSKKLQDEAAAQEAEALAAQQPPVTIPAGTEPAAAANTAAAPGPAPVSSPILKTCSLAEIEQVSRERKKAVVLVTQPSCPYCPGAVTEAERVSRDRVPVVEVSTGAGPECNDLANQWKIENTPGIILFRDGVESGRIVTSGKTLDDLASDLEVFIGGA